eukprot:TRINITY_DN632_c0_g3_i1.p1 TRINITY_DN632_c0_g3~~TRINITY_DN632_c0_g3_i1.p1  ORF type:complete len:399 (+),score=142.81 TRINITY_DN632_c0_g3_i1:380-1576(+)
MPPKAKPNAAAKADVAKKQKQVEDKTFGLKNKNKSKTVQKYVQHLQQGVTTAKKHAGVTDPKDLQKKKREDAAARDKELNDIFKVAISQPKVPAGVDPKSILCEFYRRGQCAKGFKCKFSHDLGVERKVEKIDLFSDRRDGDEESKTMEDWDQDKLKEVVAQKGAEYKNKNKATEIVCKFFLEAVEKKQYGWFWTCPNGGQECPYRHALPQGYVLKSQMKALLEEEQASRVTIEEEIEMRRHATTTVTPLTTALFQEWKRKKEVEKEKERAAEQAHRFKSDRMSGRELFSHDASLFVDDEDGFAAYERDEEEEEEARPIEAGSSASHAPSANGAAHPDVPSSSGTALELNEEEEELLLEEEEDEELDLDLLEEKLEAELAHNTLEDPPRNQAKDKPGA